MEQNLPVKAKKFWHIVRAALFMLHKGISKSKLLLADLHMMMKFGKVASKAIQNLMFHHSHHWVAATSASAASRRPQDHHLSFTPQPDEYEFSCSNSPVRSNFHLPFSAKKRRKNQTPPPTEEDDQFVSATAVMKAFKMLQSETASPALPGFGKSPMVRQLRVTDSPYPLVNLDEDSYVDEAAENFIKRFYKELKRQNDIAWDQADEYKSR